MRDWQQWHRSYDDPSSTLSRRLTVVRRRVSGVLDAPRSTPIRVLSLCAGDGRDLLPVLARSPTATDFVVLVERDPDLARSARGAASELQLDGVTVVTGDAGDPARFAAAYPVDLLLLCGIFGNISETDIQSTVAATPALLRDEGTVIWTRGSTEPDLRPQIRRWFTDAGLREVAFESEPLGYGVGIDVRPAGVEARALTTDPLFRFIV